MSKKSIEIHVIGLFFQRLVAISEPIEHVHILSILLKKLFLGRSDCFPIDRNQSVQDIIAYEVAAWLNSEVLQVNLIIDRAGKKRKHGNKREVQRLDMVGIAEIVLHERKGTQVKGYTRY